MSNVGFYWDRNSEVVEFRCISQSVIRRRGNHRQKTWFESDDGLGEETVAKFLPWRTNPSASLFSLLLVAQGEELRKSLKGDWIDP